MSKFITIIKIIFQTLKKYYLLFLLFLISLFSLLFDLNSWPKLISSKASLIINQVTGPSFLITNPTNLIEKLTSYSLYLAHLSNFKLIEIIFSILTLVNILLVYKIFKDWFNQYLAFLMTVIVSSSLIYLYQLRFINDFSQTLIILPFFFIIKSLLNHRQIALWKFYLISVLAWLIFLTPTGLFYLIVLILTSLKNLKYHFFQLTNLTPKVILISFNLLFLVFNVIILIAHKSYGLSLIGFNNTKFKLINILFTVKNLTIGSQHHSLIMSTPLLNIFMLIMLILGLMYSITSFKHSNRSKTLISLLLVSLAITSFNFVAGSIVLISVVYFIALIGLVYYLQTWLKQFPYNNLAKIIAYSLIIILISFSTIYSYREFFVVLRYSHDYLSLL